MEWSRWSRGLGRNALSLVVASMTLGCGTTDSIDPSSSGPSNSGSGGRARDGGGAGAGGRAGGSTGGSTGGASGGSATDASRDSGLAALPRNQIAATHHGTCALDARGAILCWGLARLGNPGGWQVPQGSFVEIVADTDAVCAIRQDRTFTCFPEPVGSMLDYSFVPNVKVRQVASARGVVCGVDDQGQPFCKAANPDRDVPVPAGERFAAISAGILFACGIREGDGSILCWGSEGEMTSCTYSPRVGQLDAPSGSFTTIVSRGYSSCSVRRDGALACWGAGGPGADAGAMFCSDLVNFGQSLPPQGAFRQVDVSINHACGVRSDGAVMCWGAGRTDLGCDGPDAAFVYDCGQSMPPSGKFEQVVVGNLHSCAMRTDRTVACWGWEGTGDGRTIPPAVFQ